MQAYVLFSHLEKEEKKTRHPIRMPACHSSLFLFLLRSLPFNLGDLEGVCVRKDKLRRNEGARSCTKEGVPGGSDVDDGIRSEMNAAERVVIALRKGEKEGE